jgi:hypothetical protein
MLGSLALLLSVLAASSGPWTPLQPIPGLASEHAVVWQLAGDPAQPQELAAATSRGVWVSSDDGLNWTSTAVTGYAWAVDFTSSGGTLYAGTAHSGVYRSSDGGLTWRQENTGLRSLDVRAITSGPTAIVLGTQKGVYVSGNGLGWAQAGLSDLSISSVAIIADTPLGVVAGSDQVAQTSNLYRSLSVGVGGGWQALPGGDPGGAAVSAVATGPLAKTASIPPLLVGNLKGLYVSSNGGDTWQAQTLAGGVLWSVNTIAFDPDNPQVVYVGGDNGGSSGGGLQRSVDGGGSWAVFQQGLPASGVTSVDALPTSPLTVLAAVWNATSRSPDTAKALDTSAPGPVALHSSSGTPISVAVSPTPTATPSPRHHRQKPAKPISVPVWVMGVAAAVVVLLAILVPTFLRRRRRRLDAEAPP